MRNINLTDVEESIDKNPFAHLARVDNLYLGSNFENHEQVEFLKSLGITFAIDLKQKGESDFQDKEALKAAGINYYHFPVTDISEISFDELCTLTRLLQNSEHKKMLYCMSGNRAASVLALQQSLICGHPKKRTLELAQRVGLTKDGLADKLKTIFKLK